MGDNKHLNLLDLCFGDSLWYLLVQTLNVIFQRQALKLCQMRFPWSILCIGINIFEPLIGNQVATILKFVPLATIRKDYFSKRINLIVLLLKWFKLRNI